MYGKRFQGVNALKIQPVRVRERPRARVRDTHVCARDRDTHSGREGGREGGREREREGEREIRVPVDMGAGNSELEGGKASE